MKDRTRSQLSAADVQSIAEVSRTRAIEIICHLGGIKDVSGRWKINARKFYVWYNTPCRWSLDAAGGEYILDIDRIVSDIHSFASDGKVSFTLCKRGGSPNWALRIFGTDKRERLVSLGTSDKRMAKELHATIITRSRQAEIDGIIPCKTRDVFSDWLKVKEKTISPKSYARYRAVLDKATMFMPEYAHQVNTGYIERYRDWLTREEYGARTIIIEMDVLSEVFAKAIRLGYAKVNPVDGVEKPSKPEPCVVRYKEEELTAIFAECDKRVIEGGRDQSKEAWAVYREIFYCLYYTGMRVSDVLALTWENVNLKFSTIRARQIKTGREVFIRIPSPLKSRLIAIADDRESPAGFVFINTNGHRVTYNRMDHAIRSILKECGITKKSPIHAFRHTAAMRLLAANAPVYEVAAQLGDTVDTVVRNYVKPEAMAQGTVDRAFEETDLLSRKCPENMKDMEDSEASRDTSKTQKNTLESL